MVWWYKFGRAPAFISRPTISCPIEEAVRLETKKQQNQVYAGLPKYAGTEPPLTILYNQAYVVGYSEFRENPLWVGYRLERTHIPLQGKRPSKFTTDSRTKSRVESKEYNRVGYDRGHLAPSFGIGHSFGPDAQRETFLMSNIAPQKPNLNRKVWKNLEEQENNLADSFGPIWVLAGPIFDDHRQLLDDGVEIPDEFFKIIIDEQGDQIRVLPFIIPQEVQGREQLGNFLTTVDEIESLTHLDFFSPLSDANENRLEAAKPTRIW